MMTSPCRSGSLGINLRSSHEDARIIKILRRNKRKGHYLGFCIPCLRSSLLILRKPFGCYDSFRHVGNHVVPNAALLQRLTGERRFCSDLMKRVISRCFLGRASQTAFVRIAALVCNSHVANCSSKNTTTNRRVGAAHLPQEFFRPLQYPRLKSYRMSH